MIVALLMAKLGFFEVVPNLAGRTTGYPSRFALSCSARHRRRAEDASMGH